MTFWEDLKFGNSYELKSLKYFEFKEYEQMKGNFKEYDILLDGKIKIETKADRLTYKTGNFCIEYESNGVKSGLTTTTSDYYVYFVVNKDKEDDVYVIPTDKLRSIIENGNYKTHRGGYRYLSRFYLVPRDVFKEYKQNNNIE